MITQAVIALLVGLAGSGIGIKIAVAELTVRVDDISETLTRTEDRGAMLFENKLAINSADMRIANFERSVAMLQMQVNECMRRDVAQGAHESMMGRIQALEHERNWFGRMMRNRHETPLPNTSVPVVD